MQMNTPHARVEKFRKLDNWASPGGGDGLVAFHQMISSVAIAILVLSAFRVVQAADYFPPPDSEGGWRTLKDAAQIRESAGMDLRRLEQAFDFTQRCTQNGGLLIVRHGYLVFEKYFGRAHRNA